MSDISIFTKKEEIPTEKDLIEKLGSDYELWKEIVKITYNKYPNGFAEWNFPGKKYGWSYRIKDKRRAILYFLPRDGFFKIGLVFGDKAVHDIMQTDISEKIKTDLQAAKKYAEGRGVHIVINNKQGFSDIEKLIEIKLRY